MITYDAAIRAGEKGQEPQHALQMFQKRPLRGLLCKVITYAAAFSAGAKGQKPQYAWFSGKSAVHSLLWLMGVFLKKRRPRCEFRTYV